MAGENKRVQRIGVYIEGKLIVELESVKYGHSTNSEQGHGFDGAQYFTDGNHTTTVDFNTITPKLGHEAFAMKNAAMNDLDVRLALTVDGGIEEVRGRITNRDYDSDSKSGNCKCAWKFIGGKPKQVA